MPLGNSAACFKTQKIKYFDFTILISSDTSEWKLNPVLIGLGWDKILPIRGSITIDSGVTISGNTTTLIDINGKNSFIIDSYHVKSKITVINNGTIIGSGGQGGNGNIGGNGGNAMLVYSKIKLFNNGRIIGGGGGGGGCAGGGGGGAGIPAGKGGAGGLACQTIGSNPSVCLTIKYPGTDGTSTTGGIGGVIAVFPNNWLHTGRNWSNQTAEGGNGGDLASAGGISGQLAVGRFTAQFTGGAAGKSIVGYSTYVTLDPNSTGTLTGATS